MKEASGELNMTLITIIAVGAIIAFFWFMWPTISSAISNTFNNASSGHSCPTGQHYDSQRNACVTN